MISKMLVSKVIEASLVAIMTYAILTLIKATNPIAVAVLASAISTVLYMVIPPK